MVRSAVADDHLLAYITDIARADIYSIGLILGQTCFGKDYVIHLAKTPPFQTDEDKAAGCSPKQPGSISEFNESWIADHARQATRMLPGGMYVLGVFVISPEDVLSPFHPKVKSVLNAVHKLLESTKYLYGNTDTEKLVVSYSTKLKRCFTKAYDVVTSNVQPAEIKFVPKGGILEEIDDGLVNTVFLFDGEFKDGDENLESIGRKKKAPRLSSKGFQDTQENSKPIHVSMYQSSESSVGSELHEVFESGGQLRIVGQVASKLWLQPKMSIGDAAKAIRQDIMHINCVHEPPRRVLITLPNSTITLSDYLFPGEGAQDTQYLLKNYWTYKLMENWR
ncbi:hypothetical protein NQ318_011767 [Aromia moschata]|uniref:Protein kinase domain-containing protein n=1 Tax=Aromia moschata TaxID=1265417 RepID=A0AAV8XZD4_9CUCU|nr:hypothetical protein NQ318_011767 [Aromia moschata]